MNLSSSLLEHLERTTGETLRGPRITTVSGGDINVAYRLQAAGIDWFIKLNRASLASMFAAEANGLQALASLNAIKTPRVITYGKHQQHAYLVLEYIHLTGLRGNSVRLFAQQLAALHREPQTYFGWHIDNTIGTTQQHNQRHNNWIHFWRDQRLGKQLQFAAEKGFTGKLQSQGEKLLEKLPIFFTNHDPQPSLLHGDLWAGNASSDDFGNPVIFDPACYYGDRETDLAMTELFGGFGADFYAAYQSEFPLDTGYSYRKTLYNLYHILNHLNLFGSSYLGQAENMIDQLLALT